MNNNPLIAKWEELYKPKEEPKPPTLTKDELEALAPYVNTNSNKLTTSSNPNNYITASNAVVSVSPIKSYDPYSSQDAFLEMAEKVKNQDAKVTSVTINCERAGMFSTGLQTITFEVQIWSSP